MGEIKLKLIQIYFNVKKNKQNKYSFHAFYNFKMWNIKVTQQRLVIWFIVLNATFSIISAISWRPVLVVEEAGEPPTMSKQLVNFITCGCESSAPFFNNVWKIYANYYLHIHNTVEQKQELHTDNWYYVRRMLVLTRSMFYDGCGVRLRSDEAGN